MCEITDQDKTKLGWEDLVGKRIVAMVKIQVYGDPSNGTLIPVKIRRVNGESKSYNPMSNIADPDL
jgi:hypothetical protein